MYNNYIFTKDIIIIFFMKDISILLLYFQLLYSDVFASTNLTMTG